MSGQLPRILHSPIALLCCRDERARLGAECGQELQLLGSRESYSVTGFVKHSSILVTATQGKYDHLPLYE